MASRLEPKKTNVTPTFLYIFICTTRDGDLSPRATVSVGDAGESGSTLISASSNPVSPDGDCGGGGTSSSSSLGGGGDDPVVTTTLLQNF